MAKKKKSAVKAKPKAKAAKAKPKPKVKAKAAAKPKLKLTPKLKQKPATKPKQKPQPKQAKSPVKLQVIKGGLSGKSEAGGLFSPLDDRVLVQREGAAQVTAGGIIIPDSVSAGERPNQGLVIAVGRGHRDKKGRLRPLDVKKGDHVMFAAFAGSEVQIVGDELLVLRESEIIAVLKT